MQHEQKHGTGLSGDRKEQVLKCSVEHVLGKELGPGLEGTS